MGSFKMKKRRGLGKGKGKGELTMSECCRESHVWNFKAEREFNSGAKDLERDTNSCVAEDFDAGGDFLADIHGAGGPDRDPARVGGALIIAEDVDHGDGRVRDRAADAGRDSGCALGSDDGESGTQSQFWTECDEAWNCEAAEGEREEIPGRRLEA